MDLYAWVGEDELGSGEIGLKQGYTRAGLVPLVAIRRDKMDNPNLLRQLVGQAARYGKTIRLVRFTEVEVVKEIEPDGK
jgi:hypothetical protein